MKDTKNRKFNIRSNRGSTIAETLVAFAVLTIVSLALISVISFAKHMFMEAADKRERCDTLEEKDVTGELTYQACAYDYNAGGTTKSARPFAFSLTLDTEKTPTTAIASAERSDNSTFRLDAANAAWTDGSDIVSDGTMDFYLIKLVYQERTE